MSEEWVEVPPAELSEAALTGLIEQYVLREGTEYGARDYSLAEKVASVRRQLAAGDARILYNSDLAAAELVMRGERPRRSTPNPGPGVRGG